MHQETLNNPGCYGSPLCYSAAAEVCSACNFAEGCAVAAKTRAASLMEKYGIKALLRRAVTKEPVKVIPYEKPKSVTRAETPKREILLQKMVAVQFSNMQENGIDLKESVANRTNPFHKSVCAFMYEAVEMLLSGAITITALSKHYESELKLGAMSANTFAEVAMRVILRSGAGERELQRWSVVPCKSLEDADLNVLV